MNKTALLRYGYLLGLAALLTGLPLSRFLISAAEFFLALTWILDVILNKSLVVKLKSLFKNKAALALLSLYLMHVVGLLWTKNLDYGFHDLRIKAPLFIFPVILATIPPLTFKELKGLFSIYLLANLLGVFLAFYHFLFEEISNIRQIVWFNSHIRFSLNLVVAIIVSVWMMKELSWKRRIPFITLILIYSAFLIKSQAMTGVVILLFIVGFYALRFVIISKNKKLKAAVAASTLIAVAAIFLYVDAIYKDTAVPKESKEPADLEKTTKGGNPYYHEINSGNLENGYWVWIYISEPELKESWEARSALSYEGSDLKGNSLKATLIRYLAGKGLRKDAEGIAALSEQDIHNIENGIPNHYYAEESGVKTRIRVTIWEFHVWKSSNQIAYSSTVQRFELWRAACYTIKTNFFFGVGTGDAIDAQNAAYEAIDSSLPPKFRHNFHPHNQYLSIFAAFGIFGFLWFLFTLIYPGVKKKRFSQLLYVGFFITIMLSMIAEDTLETQAGATFFAFFNSFFLFLYPEKEEAV